MISLVTWYSDVRDAGHDRTAPYRTPRCLLGQRGVGGRKGYTRCHINNSQIHLYLSLYKRSTSRAPTDSTLCPLVYPVCTQGLCRYFHLLFSLPGHTLVLSPPVLEFFSTNNCNNPSGHESISAKQLQQSIWS